MKTTEHNLSMLSAITGHISELVPFSEYRVVKWFFTAGSGVVLDLAFFHILTFLGVLVFFCNMISSLIAVTFVYLTSVRFVFIGKKYGLGHYILFIAYYALSITFFSFLITTIVNTFNMYPFWAKVVTLPVSFIINYFFASKIV